MGRQAKLKQQRRQGEVQSKTTPRIKQSPWARFVQRPTGEEPEQKSKQQSKSSFFGKLLDRLPDRLNPLAKADDKEDYLDGEAFFTANEQVLGAIAWEGYEKNHQKGVVFVRDMGEAPFQISFIAQGALKKKLSRLGIAGEDLKAIAETVKNSHPQEDIVLLFCDRDGEIAVIFRPTQPSPPECYQTLIQES